MRLGLGLGVKNSTFVGGYDSATSAFLAATGITSKTESDAINDLVVRLKGYGLWGKMKAIYPFVSDTYNTFNYSSTFTTGWLNQNTSATIDVNGPLNIPAYKITTTGSSFCQIYQSAAIKTGTYTYQFWVKSASVNAVNFRNGSSGAFIAGFDFTTNTTSNCTRTDLGSGWSLLKFTYTSASDVELGIYLSNSIAGPYTSTLGVSLLINGAQAELGSIGSTYQPIATTPANRFVSQFKYNLKDPRDLDAAFRLAFNGTWAYSKQGATPNGVNGYADTYYLESANATLNSGHISYYSRTNIAGNPFMGASNGTTETNIYPNNGGTFYPRIQATNSGVPSVNLNADAYFIASRINATEVNGYRNTTKYTVSNPTVSLNNLRRYYLGAGNDSTIRYNANQTAFSTIGDGLTDIEATNLYTSVQLFNQDLSRQVGVPIVSDADAQSFLNAAQITDLTQANAINTLVVGLKNASLWTKMKAIYPFVGGTATSHKWNLKDPRDLDAAYRLAFFGAWTHSSTGALPNGTNAYADTKCDPSTILTANNISLSIYSRTNSDGVYCDLGASTQGSSTAYQYTIYSRLSNVTYTDLGSQTSGRITYANTDSRGHFISTRTSSTSFKSFINSTLKATLTTAQTQPILSRNVYLSANFESPAITQYSNRQLAFAHIADGLNDSEVSAFYTLVQNYQTSLSRQV